MERLQLQNKSVLITGADNGIGKAIALLFAKEGADISLSIIKTTKMQKKQNWKLKL